MRIREALSACLQWILGVLNAGATTELEEIGNMRGKRDRLRELRNVLRGAEQREIRRESMAPWLREVKVLADDAEDWLDDFQYEEHRCKVLEDGDSSYGRDSSIGGGGSSSSSSRMDCSLLELLNHVSNFLSSPCRPRQGSVCDAMASRMDGIWRRFNVIAKEGEVLNRSLEFVDRETQMDARRQVRETSSFLIDPEVFGRDKVKEEIIEFLKAPTERLSVLAIVGIGGLGKTTLAQFVYNDERVTDYFHPKIWIHVSHDFDVTRVTKQIIEHVDPQLLSYHMDNLNVLQQKLEERLRDKCFLLVLDDVWYEDNRYKYCNKWQELCAPLNGAGKNGSKILITTRSIKVADIAQPVKPIELAALAFDDCWSLLKKHAFTDGNTTEYPRLEVIGKEIVKKLNGVPLAATTIGSLLKMELEEQAWRSVLESELWELEQGVGDILPALRLSYEHLPLDLKPCFAYFAVFPRGCKFDKLVLLQQWMASGYIQSDGRKQMEDIGSDYLTRLMSRSLVQYVDSKCFVHDLLHDLGRFIRQHDFRETEIKQLHKSVEDQHLHHLLLEVNKRPDLCELEKLQNFRKLRTCSFRFSYRGDFQIPCSLFMSLTCLRVLNLTCGVMEVLPDSIGNLRHLRYLDLRGTPIRYLPESLCSLYMLQTLKLRGCNQLDTLPKSMSNLVNLRYLEARHELVSKVHKIGMLTHLQEIDVFSISEGDGIKIEDLKDLDELRGRLCIQNLQRVGSEEEASRANLSNKKYIKKLELEWVEDWDVNYRNSELEEAVLDALLPPPNLKELTIIFYDGDKFPGWMMNYQSISSLVSISLRRCPRWEALPLLLGQLPYLKTLDIACFPQLKELPPLPTTITNLRLQDVRLHAVSGLERLSSLQELVLSNIPGLRELPPLPTTLKIMTVENLGLEFLPVFYKVHRGLQGGASDNNHPFLEKLEFTGCQNLRSLGGVLRHELPYLTILSIKDCKEVVFWPEEEGFKASLRSLQDELVIENCPKLMALPEGSVISQTLKKLTVTGCPAFPDRSFFVQLKNMKNLKRAGDVYVKKLYKDLASCSEEALQQTMAVDVLEIQFTDHNGGGELPFISLVYDIIQDSKPRCLDLGSNRRLTLTISSRNNYDNDDGYSCSSILSTCLLRHHHLRSSLLVLSICNMPYGGFLLPRGGEDDEASFTPHMPSLRELVFDGCRGMERFPVETPLCHLTQLKCLSIINCPGLTLPSVEEAIQSLPSLEALAVSNCPNVSLPIPNSPAASVGDGEMPTRVEESSSSSPWWCSSSSCPPASSSNSSSPRPLRSLITDDVRLVVNKQFARDHLTSLEHLVILSSNNNCFPVAKEDSWLRSLRTLSFIRCPNLQELPTDLGSLVPSLEGLCIVDCPRLRCMPERGLPPSLQGLLIYESPVLEVDWPKVALFRLIVIDGIIVQGSFSDYREMVAEEKIFRSPFRQF